MTPHSKVTNYKCLADVALDLTPLHVVIGQNDAGKTSLLEAILALHRSSEEPLADAFPGRWDGTELVYEGATKPIIDLQTTLIDETDPDSILKYRVSVEFPKSGRKCVRIIRESR